MTITKFDRKMFKLAKEVAETSSFEPHHLGCVIVYKKHVIAVGANSHKSHPAQKMYNSYRNFTKGPGAINHSLHAEMAALMSIYYPIAEQIDWKQVKVYTYRICKSKKFGMARPCAACMAALQDYGVRHIYYTTNDNSYCYERLN